MPGSGLKVCGGGWVGGGGGGVQTYFSVQLEVWTKLNNYAFRPPISEFIAPKLNIQKH